MSTFTRNTKIILSTDSNSIYLGESIAENVLTVSGSTIVRGTNIYAGNRGIALPDGTIANFAAYTAGSAPTDRLAIYQGTGTTRIATMVRATGGGKTAGSVYEGDSVDDADYLGIESAASDGGGAAAAAYLLLLQPKWGKPSGFAKRYSSKIITS
tara:strand:+ start:212 stop:676 length:465 start_codon:yes stop_codon:yes gene_type:complete